MNTEELIPANIVVGDRTYRVKLKPSDEEAVRKTLKTINDKIVEFKANFAAKDMQDYIAMVVVWYATQSEANDANALQIEEIKKALLSLDNSIENK